MEEDYGSDIGVYLTIEDYRSLVMSKVRRNYQGDPIPEWVLSFVDDMAEDLLECCSFIPFYGTGLENG